MSTLGVWLVAREPSPPEPLREALRDVGIGGRDATGRSSLAESLSTAARERLDRALARPGRERKSAFRLLEADALFTYACEAALEGEDAMAALRRILAAASG